MENITNINFDEKYFDNKINCTLFDENFILNNIKLNKFNDLLFKIKFFKFYRYTHGDGTAVTIRTFKIFTNYNFYIIGTIRNVSGRHLFDNEINLHYIYPYDNTLNYSCIYNNNNKKLYGITEEFYEKNIKYNSKKILLPMVYLDYFSDKSDIDSFIKYNGECSGEYLRSNLPNIITNKQSDEYKLFLENIEETILFFEKNDNFNISNTINKHLLEINDLTILNKNFEKNNLQQIQLLNLNKENEQYINENNFLKKENKELNITNYILEKNIDSLQDKSNYQQNQLLEMMKEKKQLKLQLETATDLLEKLQMKELNL
jgi:hypothetical protein